jgi:hypothetical protein
VSATMKSNHRNVAVFYALIYAITYLLFSYGPYRVVSGSGTVPDRILSASVDLLFLTLPVIYTLRRGSQSGHMLSSIGFRRKGILTSFIWANAFLLPIMLILLGMLLVAGPASLLAISQVPLPPSPVPVWYPLFAPVAWLIGGIAFFPILQAFPYENLMDLPKKYTIPLIAALSSGIYNFAFLTGDFRWDDILFFGLLFTIAYHKSRNSIGIVAAYVLAESGVWYVVALTWGTTVFTGAILARTILSMISVGVLIFWRYRSGRESHSAWLLS